MSWLTCRAYATSSAATRGERRMRRLRWPCSLRASRDTWRCCECNGSNLVPRRCGFESWAAPHRVDATLFNLSAPAETGCAGTCRKELVRRCLKGRETLPDVDLLLVKCQRSAGVSHKLCGNIASEAWHRCAAPGQLRLVCQGRVQASALRSGLQ
eukprot:2518312-Rhodomonas_salina.1